MHSTPHPDPTTLSARSGPTLLPPRPCSSSVPPTSKTIKRMAIRYMPVTETVTPPISSVRAHADDPQTEPDTPSPTQKPGRSRGRGKWRAPQTANPGVGTRSKTKQLQTEMDQTEATQAQASRAAWPPRNDNTEQLQRMTRELQIADRLQDVHSDMLRMLPVHKVDQNQNVVRPPVVGIQTQQQDIFFIPPPLSRCWWHVGELHPSEHGNTGAHPSIRSISCGTTARGPSLVGHAYYAPSCVLYYAFNTHGNVGTAGGTPAVGGGHATTRRTVESKHYE